MRFLISEGARQHLWASFRHRLLAVRSLVDARIERLEKKREVKSAEPTASRRPRRARRRAPASQRGTNQ